MKEGLRPGKNTLTFSWQHSYRLPWLLTAFMAASVLLHAISFYAFQVVYPIAATLRIPAARLTVLDLSDPAYLQLRNRIEAENPALILSTLRMADADVTGNPVVGHKPSYSATSPGLRTPSFERAGQTPGPGDLFRSLVLPKGDKAAPEFVAASLPVVGFITPEGMELEVRGQIEPPRDLPLEPTAPAVFLVSLNSAGRVEGVLLLESSGIDPVDLFAEAVLRDANVVSPTEVAELAGVVHVLVYPRVDQSQPPSKP